MFKSYRYKIFKFDKFYKISRPIDRVERTQLAAIFCQICQMLSPSGWASFTVAGVSSEVALYCMWSVARVWYMAG